MKIQKLYVNMFKLFFVLSLLLISINLNNFGIKANPIEKFFLFLACFFLLLMYRLPKTYCYIIFCLLLTVTLAAVFSSFEQFSWLYFFSGLLSISIPIVLFSLDPDEKCKIYIIQCISLLPMAYIALGLVLQIFGFVQMVKVDYLGVARLAGSTSAAYFGASAAAGALASIVLADKLGNLKYLLLGAIYTVFVLLSGSRMATAILFICAVPFVYFGFVGRLNLKLALTYFSALVGLPVVVIMFSGIVDRFLSNSASGRDLIWEYLLSIASKYPLSGVGLGHQYTLFPEELSLAVSTVAAHNEYLRLRVELGYPASVIFICLLVLLFLVGWRSRHISNTPAYFLGCIGFFIFCFTDNTLSAPSIFFIFLVAFYGSSIAAVKKT